MAVTVSSRGTTKVKRVVVGKPIRRINPDRGHINTIGGVDTSNRIDGSVLVYNESNALWEATIVLDSQEINGGNY